MLGGIFGGLIQSGSTKRDRQETLSAYGDLSNVFNFALPAATEAQGAGQTAEQKAGDYYSKLLSGNRPAVLQAVAPQTAAISEATDARRRQLGTSGTARGGGVNATNQTAEDKKMADIDQLLFGARNEAAKGEERVGSAELSDATNLLGLGANAASNLGNLSVASRNQNLQVTQNTVQATQNAILEAMASFA